MTDTRPADRHGIDDRTLREIYPRLRRLAAVVGPAEVGPDDLVQEAFEKLFAHGTVGIDHVEAYLRRVIVHSAANHRRGLGRGRRAFNRLAGMATSGEAAAEYPSDLQFLESLAPVARAVLYLQEVEGFDLRTVGDELGLSQAAVKQTALRARRQLRHHLTEDLT